MEADGIVRVILIAASIVVILLSFWLLSMKKMTVDFTVIWESFGLVLLFVGAVPALFCCRAVFYKERSWTLLCLGVAGVLICYQLSLIISGLMVKNQELAIEVSLLLGEKGEQFDKPEKELLIILPVYNEERSIEKVLEQLSRPEIQTIADVLVVNDCSSDSSGQRIGCYPCVQITHVYGLGYGSALQLGYKYAVRKNYRYVIQMDADGQHDPCNIPHIYRRLQERDANGRLPDIVLASRFMEESSEFSVSSCKKFAYGLFRCMIRAATSRKIADPTTGLQGLNRKTFTYYSGYDHFDYRYPDANMIVQMLLLRYNVVEVPAVMHLRTDGKSMHSGLEPVWYMMCMVLNVLAVIFRIKVMKVGTRKAAEEDL